MSSYPSAIGVPASPAQQRLWFIHQLDRSAGRAYHVGCAVRLSGDLDVSALGKALDGLIERHEVLRARFVEKQGTPLMVITPPEPFALQVNDSLAEADVQRYARAESQTAFDLTTGPLIRGRLLRMSAREHVLMLTMHHIVCDGWSLGIIIREVAALYAAFREGLSNPLPPLPSQFWQYVQSRSQWLTGAVLDEQMAFWREQLRGAPSLLDLPLDRERPAHPSFRGATREFRLGATLCVGLRRLSRLCGVTLYMVLYTGWAITLSRLSGQEEVVIGTPVANRQTTQAEQMIGLFVNTLALRADLRGAPSILDLLVRIKAMMLAAWSHQEIPFEHVVELLKPPRTLRHNAIFQVWFVLQNTPQSEVRIAELSLAPVSLPAGSAQFDLSLSMQEGGAEILGDLNYATDLFDSSTVERWIGYFINTLSAMVHDPGQRVGEVDLGEAA